MNHEDFKIQAAMISRGELEAPCPDYHGQRGIITLAGGRDYFVNAYVNVRLLRHLGCTLPIAWYYLGAEMTEEMVAIAQEVPNVVCYDIRHKLNVPGDRDFKKNKGGWQAKTKAMRACPFDTFLYLDADSFVWKNPTFLFDCLCGQSAIFWPDISNWRPDQWPVLDDIFGVPYKAGPTLEAGQIVLDRKKCWKALCLADFYNEHPEITYKVLYGDKDTFYMAWERTRTPYRLVPQIPEGRPGCLLQHDLNGRFMFTHCTQAKWSLGGRPLMLERDFPHREVCRGFIAELRKKWSVCHRTKASVK